MKDPHNNDLDGVLFRFWCRAASYPGGWPSELMKAIQKHSPKGPENMQPHHYRAALMELAQAKGVNFPTGGENE